MGSMADIRAANAFAKWGLEIFSAVARSKRAERSVPGLLAREEEHCIRAERWRAPQRSFFAFEPTPAGFLVKAEAAFGARLEKGEATINANNSMGVRSTRRHHALHQRLMTKHLVERRPIST
jgi:hypothetical protein